MSLTDGRRISRSGMVSRNVARSVGTAMTAARGTDRESPLVRFAFTLGLIFLFPAFVFQLARDPSTGEFTGSLILQLANVGCEVYALMIIFGSRQVSELVLRCRPLWILIGLAFASTLWSYNPAATFRASHVFLITSMFGLAMAGRLSPFACMQLLIRTMVLGCALSIIWVFVFPVAAVHQATDLVQSVHAGLWRGIFSHKQSLGVFAGLTTGFLLFYNSSVFSAIPLRIGAIACSVTCLIGTQSVTGILTAIFMTVVLYLTYRITQRPQHARKSLIVAMAVGVSTFIAGFHLGLFNFIPPLLGKSADLTGRADVWPWVLANFASSGSTILGGGLLSGFSQDLAPGLSIDSGYIEMLAAFGYLGITIMLSVFGWLILANVRLIIATPPELGSVVIFPFTTLAIMLFVNISEGIFMTKHIGTVLIAVAAGQIIQLQGQNWARPAVRSKSRGQ